MVDTALLEGPWPVRTLGPIIHNPCVVEELASRGAIPAGAPEEVSKGTLVLRSHGTSLEDAARVAPGVRLVDATCPFVTKAQKTAQKLAGMGIPVVLVGDKDHPETKAILSYAGGLGVCVKSTDDLDETILTAGGGPIAVLAQTTSRPADVENIVEALKKAGISVKSSNTICTATHERQEATMELAKMCEIVLVVGGRTSANTRRLLEIARDHCAEAHLVESATEVQARWFVGKSRVGIAAGASTPDRVIKEVVGKVEELEKSNLGEEPEENKEQKVEPQDAESQDKPSEPILEAEAHDVPEPEEEEISETAVEQDPAETVEDLYDESFKVLEEGQIVPGRVVSVDDNGALVDVGAKSEGLIPISELQRKGAFPSKPLSPGDEVMVYVQSFDLGEGTLRLSKRRADEEISWEKLSEVYNEGALLEAPVVQEVKGGLVVDVGLRGFVPASQVERGYVNDLSKYVGRNLRLKVLELDRGKNRVVLSQRVVLEEEHEALCKETWETISEGQVRSGVVKGITDFGVFVDLGGVDGLLHISELAWGRVKHPSEVVREGDELDVKVLRIDRDKGKISLGRKQVLPDPWIGVDEKYPVDSVFMGEVTRTAPFGAFVQLEPGVEGLVHISEVSQRHITKPEEEVGSGDRVRVKVLRVRPDERRISLSMRQVDQFDLDEAAEEDTIPEVQETLGDLEEQATGTNDSVEASKVEDAGEPEVAEEIREQVNEQAQERTEEPAENGEDETTEALDEDQRDEPEEQAGESQTGEAVEEQIEAPPESSLPEEPVESEKPE